MRKLSKKISMLMVLAMLVGMFSGIVSASAASAWSFKSKKYDNVAVGETIVMGNKEYADFDLLKDGKAPTGYTVTWASSDENVVWVNAKTGQLRANKLGMANIGDKAVISATFTNTATKKSATRSFVIAYGTPEYELVTKIGDVVLGEETLAVGESYKLATTVLDVDGNSVDFKTCKLYRNYFIDGKAIANPYVPEKEGEFTIVVGAFTAKADMDDLSKAYQIEEYKVTATTGEFSAVATGAKEITVYGDFAENTKFVVKRDGKVTISATPKLAEDKKSVVLTLTNKITKGNYTVTCGDYEYKFEAEDEKPVKIIVEESEDGVLNTNPARTEAYAHYDVYNQYGESIRKSTAVTFSGSTAVTPVGDPKTGLVTITATSGTTFNYGNPIILTIAANGHGAFVSATLTAGLENSVDAVKFAEDGKVLTLANGGKLYTTVPERMLGAKDVTKGNNPGYDNYKTEFYLLFKLLDRSGHVIPYTQADVDNLTLISYNPLLIQDFGTIERKFIAGEEYVAVPIVAGLHLKKGGEAQIKICSNKTGSSTDFILNIEPEQILSSFTILQPEEIIVKDDKDGNATVVTLKYEAYDINGKEITDFRALYDQVSFGHRDVVFKEQNDGTAKLTYTVDQATINPTKDYDIPVVINAIVPEGTGNSVTLYVKEARYASSIAGYSGTHTIVEHDKLDIKLGKDVTAYDQYDVVLKDIPKFYMGTTTNKRATQFGVKVQGVDGGLTIVGGNGTTAAENGAYTKFNVGQTLSLQAAKEITNNYETFLVEFVLLNAEDKVVGGSSWSETFYVADINEAVKFTLKSDDSLLENTVDTANLKVEATFSNGDKAELKNSYVEGQEQYYIVYNQESYAYLTASATGASVVTSSAAVITPQYIEDKLQTIGYFGKANQFENQAALNPDGTFASRNIVVKASATIMVGAFSGNAYVCANYGVKDIAKTSVQVGAFDRKTSEITFGDGRVNATDGKLTYGNLMGQVKSIKDNYGDAKNKLVNGDYHDKAAGNTVTITNVKENNETGLQYNSFRVKVNAVSAGDNTVMVYGAEMGDTFDITVKSFDGAVEAILHVTVGADNNAKLDSNFDYRRVKQNWY